MADQYGVYGYYFDFRDDAGAFGDQYCVLCGNQDGGDSRDCIRHVLPSLVIVLIMARIYYKYRNLDTVKGVLNGLHPAVAAMVFAAAVKLVGNAWWGGIELADFANTDWIAVALALIFLILLQKKKLGPVQSILLSGICGAVLYGLSSMGAGVL